MTLTNFSTVDKAIATSTGNTLVVSGATTNVYPTSVSDVTTASMLTSTGGTTQNWAESGSSAQLFIKENSSILFAELVWYSTVINEQYGGTDVTGVQDQAISFTTPAGTTSILPTYTEDTILNSTVGQRLTNRLRIADVTTLIQTGLSGTYTVGGVPTSIQSSGLSNTRAGWALHVVYKHEEFAPKYISLLSGINLGLQVATVQEFFSGFKTPASGSVTGKMTFVTANGEPYLPGELLRVGSSFASLQVIGNPVGVGNSNPGTSPNNPYNNPFTGQVNIADPLSLNCGKLNDLGTLGTVNNNGFVPLEVVGARNKWDLACLDISSHLTNNQTQLAFEYDTTVQNVVTELLTTIVQVDAIGANLVSTLSVDESYVEVNDIVSYCLKINNLADITAQSLVIQDTLASNIQFIPGSVTVNGTSLPLADITQGITFGNLLPYERVTVVYQVKPTNLQSPYIFTNTATYSYQFQSGSTSPVYTNSKASPAVSFNVNDGVLQVTSTPSVPTAAIGSTFDYTVTLTNLGNTPLSDIVVTDILNPATTFVANSVYVNNTLVPLADITNGVLVVTLGINESATVKFSVTVASGPAYGVIEDKVYASYTYSLPQYQTTIKKTATSDSTQVVVNYAQVIQIISNNNNYPVINDVITYTITYNNVGNINAINYPVLVQMPTGVEFIEHTVTIGGVDNPDANPTVGFTIPEICPCEPQVVTFQGLVVSIPADQQVVNIAIVPFSYQLDPDGNVITTQIDSNLVYTRTNDVNLSIIKTVDKAYATIGEKLVYKVDVTNSGNIDATNATIIDLLDSHLTFVAGTVKVNGVTQPTYNPNLGFVIPSIPTGDTFTITFIAEVTSLPIPSIVNNQAQVTYDYKPDPNGPTLTQTQLSNVVVTSISTATLTVTKSVDKTVAKVGDILTYTIVGTNIGIATLTNPVFFDTVVAGGEFVAGSLTVDTVPYPTYNPNVGFDLYTLLPGESVTVTYRVLVVSVPVAFYLKDHAYITYYYKLNPLTPEVVATQSSNYVQTKIVEADVAFVKSVDKLFATLDDILNYSFVLTNTGNISLTNVFFQDSLQVNGAFQAGSLKINNVSYAYNPNTGFNLSDVIGTWEIGESVQITFQTKVVSIPSPNTIANTATISYQYYVDQTYSGSKTSNTVETVVNKGSLELVKSRDKAYATLNDTITYTVLVHNTGNVTAQQVTFEDIISSDAQLILNSVKVDNVSVSVTGPNVQLLLSDITAGATTTVEFQVLVVSVPLNQIIYNSATSTFVYRINPTGPDYYDTATSNQVQTYINTSTVTITKTANKVYATVSDEVLYSIDLYNGGTVDLTNVYFTDPIDPYSTFVPNSLLVDDVPVADTPESSILIGTMVPNQTVNVKFRVTVNAVPPIGHIHNTASIDYQYKINPQGETFNVTKNSNTTYVYINKGTLTVTKAVDRAIATIDENLLYTFSVVNTGNTALTDLFFQDIVQTDGSSFNSGTIKVNGSTTGYETANPTTGFSLPTLAIGQSLTVSFVASVDSVPSLPQHIIDGKHVILNIATVEYSYKIDPTSTTVITATATSTQTSVEVKYAELSITKAVNKSVAKLGDTLAYTFTIRNVGYVNTSANNVVLTDTIDSNLTYVTNSIRIGLDPATITWNGSTFTLDIGTINANESVTVTFSVTVTSIPTGNAVYNNGTIDYNYVSGTTVYETRTSNTVVTNIYKASLTATKGVDVLYATVNDIIGYTIPITNTGTLSLLNLTLTDYNFNPLYTEFVTGSVVVDGAEQPLADPSAGIPLFDLAPNTTVYVSFDIKVIALPPTPYLVTNEALIDYEYLVPGDVQPTPGPTYTTNQVATEIRLAALSVTKTANKQFVTRNDEITYTVVMTNTGNTELTNLVFNDILQSEIEFVEGSIIIGTQSQPTLSLPTFNLATSLAVGESITVSFVAKVRVDALPVYVYNTATIDYQYKIDPSITAPTYTGHSLSNIATVKINVASISAVKAVDKAYATLNDTLLYTINLTNTGSVDLTTVNLLDLIPIGAEFIAGSVYVNGESRPTANPNTSIALNTIVVGAALEIRFNALVTSIPVVNPIVNFGTVTYGYKIAPTDSVTTVETTTNTVQTQINKGLLTATKSVDKSYAQLTDQLLYTVILENQGNVVVSNVNFLDILQSDISFNLGSLKVDNADTTYDPNTGFIITEILPSHSVTVTFLVTVQTMPLTTFVDNSASAQYSYKIDPTGTSITTTATSNSVRTIIKLMAVSSIKWVNKQYAKVADNLLYSTSVTNDGTVPLTNVTFVDEIPLHTDFVTGSVYVGDVPDETAHPAQGIPLDTLHPGEMKTVSFSVTVTDVPPSPYLVYNSAESTFNYKINPVGPEYDGSVMSNQVQTLINQGELTLTKSVDKQYALVSNLLIYTVVVRNTGNVPATDTFFLDPLASELSYISGTVTIDNVQIPTLSPVTGFTLGTLAPGAEKTITFDVRIATYPSTGVVENTALTQFSYQVDPSGTTTTTTQPSNKVTTNVVNPILLQTKTVSKTYATLDDVYTYTITLNNTGNTDLLQTVFRDTPSVGVTLVAGSVKINGVADPLILTTSYIELGTLARNTVTTVAFDVKVTSVPTTGMVTNKAYIDFGYYIDPTQPIVLVTNQTNLVTTYINVYGMTVVKTVDKQFATSGSILTYSVTVTNTGNVPNTNVMFTDQTPANTSLVLGSVIVNGVSYPTYHPEAGFSLGTMQPNQVAVVVYQVKINE